jgi:hypothetical protein
MKPALEQPSKGAPTGLFLLGAQLIVGATNAGRFSGPTAFFL